MSNPEAKGKQLGQARPSDTSAASIYSPDAEEINTEITLIVVCNVSGAARTFRIFHDENGTTYDATTALFYDTPLNADETIEIPYEEGSGIWMRDPSGNLAVRSDSGNGITFTVYGKEHINDLVT